MLDLRREIADRSTSLTPFGTEITLSNGTRVSYTPGCLRNYKNPCTGSNRTKELNEYKTIVREFDELLVKYKKDGTDLLKRIADLEVSHRKQLLQDTAIESLGNLAVMLTVSELNWLKNRNGTAELTNTKEQVGWRAAHDWALTQGNLDADALKSLNLTSLDDFQVAFQKVRQAQGVKFVGATPFPQDDVRSMEQARQRRRVR